MLLLLLLLRVPFCTRCSALIPVTRPPKSFNRWRNRPTNSEFTNWMCTGIGIKTLPHRSYDASNVRCCWD